MDYPRCHYCENAGRYIDETGHFSCAICPLGLGMDAIRIVDVPVLLAWVRQNIEHGRTNVWASDLKPSFLAIVRSVKPTIAATS